MKRIKKRDSIIKAIEEYDSIGKKKFLEKYRFRESQYYYLVYNGKKYASKAIYCVAYRYENPNKKALTSQQVAGNRKDVLENLGFRVLVFDKPSLPYINSQCAIKSEDIEKIYKISAINLIKPEFKILTCGNNKFLSLFLPIEESKDIWTESDFLYIVNVSDKWGKLLEKEKRMYVFQRVHDLYHCWDYFVNIYDLVSSDGGFTFVKAGVDNKTGHGDVNYDPTSIKDEREIRLAEQIRRKGQPKFRRQLIDAYNGKCAITDCDVLEILEAAHIDPYKGPTTNHVQNGILLRPDVHELFDRYLLTIHPDTSRIDIARKIEGSIYNQYKDKKIRLPHDVEERPSRDALEEHFKKFQYKKQNQ